MSKILLIIKREYWTRVRKRSFIIMTLLGPVLMALMGVVPIWLAKNSQTEKKIIVVDQDGLFRDQLKDNKFIFFSYSSNDFESEKKNLMDESDSKSGTKYDGILKIPEINIEKPEGITYLTKGKIGFEILSYMESEIERVIVEKKYTDKGFDKELIDRLKTDITLRTFDLSGEQEQETNTTAATVIGMFMAVMIYLFIFVYGAQVMRGVMEEKSSRVIEVMISSVRPFQLMMGKVLGVALVALTQFMIWIMSIVTIYMIVGSVYAMDRFSKDNLTTTLSENPGMDKVQAMEMSTIWNALETLNFPLLIGSFIFFFLAGYLFYAALFAAVGAAVDNETDTQQFMLPITIPLIMAFMVMQSILENPEGSTGFWFSIVPFTSPIVMMIRLPFLGTGTYWQLILSMILLIGGFIGTIWLASRIYRVGILMHGKKVNYKELGKWLFYKN